MLSLSYHPIRCKQQNAVQLHKRAIAVKNLDINISQIKKLEISCKPISQSASHAEWCNTGWEKSHSSSSHPDSRFEARAFPMRHPHRYGTSSSRLPPAVLSHAYPMSASSSHPNSRFGAHSLAVPYADPELARSSHPSSRSGEHTFVVHRPTCRSSHRCSRLRPSR